MGTPVFFIPGYHGSGPDHWQSWLQARLPDSSTLRAVDWELPELNAWTDQVHAQLASQAEPVLLVAHSFGCLVAAAVAAERPASVAGIVFVAPANPKRFAIHGGIRNTRFDGTPNAVRSIADILPETLPVTVPSVIIASENDPWLGFSEALILKQSWRSHFVDLGEVGHINTESGYGPWPGLLRQLHILRGQTRPDFTTLHRKVLEASPADVRAEEALLQSKRVLRQPGLKFAC